MDERIERKLSAARTRLIIDKPFLGALVLRLPLKEADPAWCRTTATDARNFYFNPDYIDALDLAQTQFVLAHEALHCALSHFARREHRNRTRWDVACDYAINPLLLSDGLTPPPGILHEDGYAGMTAEEIYPYIDEADDEEPLDQHIYDDDGADRDGGGQGASSGDRPPEAPSSGEQDGQRTGAAKPPPLGAGERQTLEVQWQQRLAGAAQQAMQAGKMGGLMARMIDHLLQPQLPWRMLLARYMTGIARDDYTWMRPSRREGAAILPSLRSAQTEIVVALDVSGSINDDQIRQFVSEVNALKGQLRARVTLMACDAALSADSPWICEPWEDLELPDRLSGGGGTDFRPVFKAVERLDRAPELLVYFTDGEGRFPDAEPAYPVLWLIKGRARVPWGQRIQFN